MKNLISILKMSTDEYFSFWKWMLHSNDFLCGISCNAESNESVCSRLLVYVCIRWVFWYFIHFIKCDHFWRTSTPYTTLLWDENTRYHLYTYVYKHMWLTDTHGYRAATHLLVFVELDFWWYFSPVLIFRVTVSDDIVPFFSLTCKALTNVVWTHDKGREISVWLRQKRKRKTTSDSKREKDFAKV